MKSTWELKNEMQGEIEAAIAPIRDAIAAKWAPVLQAARDAEARQMQMYEDNEYAEAVENALWILGTKLVEWTDTAGCYGYRKIPWEKTGRIGFYEIYHRENSAPIRGSQSHGKPFVRLAKKDGKPSVLAVRWAHWLSWLPDGEHPDTYEHPATKAEKWSIAL